MSLCSSSSCLYLRKSVFAVGRILDGTVLPIIRDVLALGLTKVKLAVDQGAVVQGRSSLFLRSKGTLDQRSGLQGQTLDTRLQSLAHVLASLANLTILTRVPVRGADALVTRALAYPGADEIRRLRRSEARWMKLGCQDLYLMCHLH